MGDQFKLSINNPCHQNFDGFKPTNAGGFCNSCQKEVIDFSKMSKPDIIGYFKNPKKETCGRLTQNQLKEEYSHIPILKSESNFLAHGAGLVGVSILSILPFSSTQAQQPDVSTTLQIENGEGSKVDVPNKIDQIDNLLSGVVTDAKTGETIPFANVWLKGSRNGASTDFDGRFKFPVPLTIGDVLVISFTGYQTQEYTITNETNLDVKLEIDLRESEVVFMGEVSIEQVYKSERTLWQKLKSFFI
ncbi:hypothetical protein Oweho_1239 [Owenweeksia hongkongensis DSM 17368]|uniref:CarboxypepD_reg-like domain-containing protein n=1 Tax=Owenweeksia hongkongensis (strain DSM 17368 / CIP 108786 / JCM 12287 / NRRL B-23963 / UST20020801) TaxID=926562 RepID=G8R654_OWEHD|nr:carboxypeptidase-like regulatory domain-containing protein [Owenweeksia hongkongensis]AEV32244.1 hypothetical protein Oweho_1239 [Owenweeksia hongkongensis DSM 17368]